METIGAVVLAAGASRRLGEAKQFLFYRGEPLVRRAVRATVETGCRPVVVVAGADLVQLGQALSGLDVHILPHAHWERGIGSSLRAGVQHMRALAPMLDGLFVLVCDQPFVTAETLTALLTARTNSKRRNAACRYAETIGVPALFDRSVLTYFDALADDQGAKAILQSMPDAIALVDFPEGAVDIDTPADWQAHRNAE